MNATVQGTDTHDAARASHSPAEIYPGTCRNLTQQQRTHERARLATQNREPSLRLQSHVGSWLIPGTALRSPVDDFVLRRRTKTNQYSYNLAIVLHDPLTGITQVNRGDDLIDSTGRQAYIAQILSLPPVSYHHVPLVLNETGRRLAKRDGTVTFEQLHTHTGHSAENIARASLYWIAQSCGRHW